MKLTVLQSKLSRALTTVSRTVSARSTLPILSHIALRTDKGRLKISATNLEIGINYYIGGKVENTGELTVPSRIFTEFITSLSDEKVLLEANKLILKVKTEKFESNFNGASAEEFPLIPDIKDVTVFSLDGKELKEAIALVSFAAATDETRPVLSGVLMKVSDSKLILAATDSYRLAEKIIDLKTKSKDELEVIVPAKTLIELSRILTENETDVEMYVGDNQIAFVAGDTELVSRLIEGQFPNYIQIIPEDTETKAEVVKDEFVQALKIAHLFARESANTVRVKIGDKEITFSAEAGGVGDNTSRLSAKVEGSGGEISFNAKYILDVFSVLKDDRVKFEISGKLNPGIIRPTVTKRYLYIVMPLKS